MRRSLSQKILAIVLVLTQLMLGDLVHLPSAHAAVPEPARLMTMVAGEACPGMTGAPAAQDHAGDCCKSAQCPCLHAPALMVTVQPLPMFSVSYAYVPVTEVRRLSGPPSLVFRPPI